ncbi:MAG: extracellular solute-binding protein [Defluviitaleaceae bacterium]|nr:extracellular solute-binding protein [Defluviitaleaceae bacterium]
MRNYWKYLLGTVLVATVLVMSACGGNGDDDTPAATDPPVQTEAPDVTPPDNNATVETPPEPTEPPRDLGGIEIIVGNWFDNSCTETFDFAGAAITERLLWEHRAYLEEKHNFRIINRRMAGWADVRDMIPDMLAAGSREVHVWTMEPAWFLGLVGDGAFAPIPASVFEADTGIDWSHAHINMSIRNGNIFGWNQGVQFNGGIYFNMRLFEEAGLPRDYLFQLQDRGEWDWDNFLRVARIIQSEIGFDAEGNINVFPLTTFHQDFFLQAMPSNNAGVVGIDPETGHFINTSNSPEFFETLQFMFQLRDEMLAMHEMDVDGEWDVFVDLFNAGRGAMRSAGHYVATSIRDNLADDWGFVAFPRGPSAPWDGHMGELVGNFHAIPHVFDADEVDRIMYALTLWNAPLPDSEPDDWMIGEFARHNQPQSITETMINYTRNPEWQRMRVHAIMPVAASFGDSFAFRVWTGENTPASVLEEAQAVWNDYIARSNQMLFGD